LNIIEANKLCRNYGNGVKMVRTGIGNILHNNKIVDNGIGANEFAKYYDGINLLGTGTGKSEFEPGNQNLDFMPSSKNIISQNMFMGVNQYHAIFAGLVCPDNMVLPDNIYLNGVVKPISDNLKEVSLGVEPL
jgi:hypothetical protein